jgi:hypothetical protein
MQNKWAFFLITGLLLALSYPLISKYVEKSEQGKVEVQRYKKLGGFVTKICVAHKARIKKAEECSLTKRYASKKINCQYLSDVKTMFRLYYAGSAHQAEYKKLLKLITQDYQCK